MNFEAYRGKRVFVTGHTGFKGSWLCEMLLMAGAEVWGYALKPPTKPSLFAQLKLAKRIKSHVTGDVRDLKALTAAVRAARPDYVFHLAAQPLVRESYRTPVETFETNVMGTVNVLEAVRRVFLSTNFTNSTNPRWPNSCNSCNSWTKKGPSGCSVICITTDKVYENDNGGRAFREGDPLGGSDPYSASKGACEIAIASYRRSFFAAADCPVKVASARAGNVIGGGDWAADRIVPDAMRAFLAGRTLTVRNRKSTRPWQHVLEPLSGYLRLGEWLSTNFTNRTNCVDALAPDALAFNFGPDVKTVKTVGQLVAELQKGFARTKVADKTDPRAPREAKLLMLDSWKAKNVLGWKPMWDFRKTIAATAEWYREVSEGKVSAREMTDRQIGAFLSTNFTNYTN